MQGETELAIDNFKRQLRLARSTNNRSQENQAIGNLGIIYHRSGNLHQALLYYQQQLLALLAIGDRSWASKCLFNMGMLYAQHGKQEQATKCYLHSLDLSTELGHLNDISEGLRDVGEIYFQRNKLSESEQALMQALKIARILENTSKLAEYLVPLAALYLKKRKYEKSQQYVSEAFSVPLSEQQVFNVHVLQIRAEHATGQIDVDTMTRALLELLSTYQDVRCKADVFYYIWRIDGFKFAYRLNATELYKQLHDNEPQYIFAKRDREMTGETLETGYDLPELSLGMSQEPDFGQIMLRISKLIER
jgi:tetratricopeptide (TPR) repeat protein